MASRLRLLVPTGRTLPDGAWLHRHHAMVGLLFVEAVGLAVFSAAQGNSLGHSAVHAFGLFVVGAAAILFERRRRAASVLVSFGLVTACALLVHIWDGAIEGHFLFFVTIVVLALYEDWIPFLVAAAYVVVHHGIAGAIDPGAVYNHPAAVAHPWKWAAIHGGFVVAAGLASVAAWRLNETLRAQEQESYRRALESEERLRRAFEGAPIGMVLFAFDANGVEVDQVNQAMVELTGHSRARLRENGFELVVEPDDAAGVIEDLGALLHNGGDSSLELSLRIRHATGESRWATASVSLLHAEADDRGYAIAQVEDVTERRQVAEELIHQALHDPLTGLGNRRSLLSDLDLGLLEATSGRPLVLLLFDLDGFKTYNDTFGHPAGDSLLLRLAKRLDGALEDRASAYRVGGDEFCVLSHTGVGDHATITRLAAAALAEHGEGFDITASYGSVLLPEEAASATEALREADRRMYAHKREDGRAPAGRQSADVLLRILSERSPALGVHLDEVTALCDLVAERLDLSGDDREPLLQAASLHDAGKIAIPDQVLDKPGPLDEQEWTFVRRHPVIGERILSAAPALARAAKLVRSSHEHFDGSGYPDGLAGSRIPLGSRVIAVCDAYSAMLAGRPYRVTRDSAAARAELTRCAGTQFDPRVVEALCDVLDGRERDSATVVQLDERRVSRRGLGLPSRPSRR
ncbi:MAG TPA: HD domain-containing phosphohydrolase [Thermoleophilaceae bacterium]|nr:HD domain-containing phosphohydrolase [Thermoleophilaceae bacterium]